MLKDLQVVIASNLVKAHRLAVYHPFSDTGKPRADVVGETVEEQLSEEERQYRMYRDILAEGELYAGVDVVDIDDKTEILVTSTATASPHSVLKVDYAQFDHSARKVHAQNDITLDAHPLITRRDGTPAESVPLDLLVWVMRRDKESGQVMPVDINDLSSEQIGIHDIDRHKLQLHTEQMCQIFETVVRRTDIATDIILDLYNNTIQPELGQLPPKKRSDILQGFLSGYYRRDLVKQFEQFYADGRGKGPMSNPTLHFRCTAHLGLEGIEDPDEFIAYLRSHPRYFADDISLLDLPQKEEPQAQQAELVRELLYGENHKTNITEILKAIDPLGSLFHDEMLPWLEHELDFCFYEMDNLITIEPFQHHTEHGAVELRASEGIEVILHTQGMSYPEKQRVLAESLTFIAQMIGRRLAPLWDDINRFVLDKYFLTDSEQEVRLSGIIQQYQLPDGVKDKIRDIVPTEKQMKVLQAQSIDDPLRQVRIERKLRAYARYKEIVLEEKEFLESKIQNGEGKEDDLVQLVVLCQKGQIFDDPTLNTGYNIPGVPGNAVTYFEDDEGNLHISMGWLLSMKGLAELWLGASIKRIERK